MVNHGDDDPMDMDIDQKMDNIDDDDDDDEDSNCNTLTYLTWNVWFNEELQVIERMKAIGRHIEKHNPDIVCFQEVTATILDILQQSPWYCNAGYSSTILPQHGMFGHCAYFNMIMTKHEIIRDLVQFKPFSNSQMGRHLILCPIKLKENDHLIYVATTHLESPIGPSNGGKEDYFSTERKEQLKCALQILDDGKNVKSNNVIFGGDMNWRTEDDDMNEYLNDGWVDCFERLHPNDNGYTHDAICNGMILGKTQNRLDRVLYRESPKGNLKLKSCQLIGREAIPNLTHIKVIKRKKGDEYKKLPVFPSHHFGLCATFEII